MYAVELSTISPQLFIDGIGILDARARSLESSNDLEAACLSCRFLCFMDDRVMDGAWMHRFGWVGEDVVGAFNSLIQKRKDGSIRFFFSGCKQSFSDNTPFVGLFDASGFCGSALLDAELIDAILGAIGAEFGEVITLLPDSFAEMECVALLDHRLIPGAGYVVRADGRGLLDCWPASSGIN